MSSLKNAVKRITHKERSQPQSRSHLGLLEKHDDYKQRAVQHHRKQHQFNSLKKRAAMRNPDEFYFGMHNSQVSNETGRHRKLERALQKERNDEIGPEAVRIMKTQDLNHVQYQLQKEKSKINKLESVLHNIHYYNKTEEEEEEDYNKNKKKKKKASRPKHTIFVSSRQEANNLDIVQHFDTLPEFMDRSFHRPRVADLEKMTTTNNAPNFAKERAQVLQELTQRYKRVQTLERAQAHLRTDKLVQSKGTKRKIKPAENGMPAQYEWKRKRMK